MEVPEINPDYLLSTDDDIYIHLPSLWGIIGAGYVIPKNLIPCLYQSALETPFIHINDAFISGYLAKMCRLSLLPAQNFQFLSLLVSIDGRISMFTTRETELLAGVPTPSLSKWFV
ncbi:hypothetical protein TCAL_15521, partial [Tigriopus californicus]